MQISIPDIINFLLSLSTPKLITILILTGVMIISITYSLRSATEFFTRNLLDLGQDRYRRSNRDSVIFTSPNASRVKTTDDEIKSIIRQVLLDESSEEHFENYKKTIKKTIEEKEKEITENEISKALSERKMEEEITNSLARTLENTTKKLIENNEHYKVLEKEVFEKLDLVRTLSFLEHLEKEYDATRSTKALVSNMFIIVNVIYFFGLLTFLMIGKGINNSSNIYLALSLSYIGFGSFVVYMIKFCNARSLTLLSLREDFLKREQLSNMANKIIEEGVNEHHVALLKLMNSGIANKEQKINHPYEMLLYGIKDSNIMFKGGKFEIKKETPNK